METNSKEKTVSMFKAVASTDLLRSGNTGQLPASTAIALVFIGAQLIYIAQLIRQRYWPIDQFVMYALLH